MLTDVAGVRVGHWTDAAARTGCTAVLLPAGTCASAEVRGGAPASRELDLLAPGRLVERLDAVLLTGGSAFGLAAADGVVRWCEERGIGFPTAAGPVPIVAALGLYDLGVGDPSVRPGPEDGYAACVDATGGPFRTGAVGAGCGATVGAWRGPGNRRRGGLGTATVRRGDLVVSALVAVNAAGDIDADGTATDRVLAALPDPAAAVMPDPAVTDPAVADPAVMPDPGGTDRAGPFGTVAPGTNTTVGVVATNAALDKVACWLVAQRAHDGYARALVPAHTRADGDAVVVAATATRSGAADVDTVCLLATVAVERAIRACAAG
ncbi:MAG: P1 family peptidase [Actinobacteria bacterium]|nr:P1 family peptidase [Actinomycetota bacterium]